MEITAYLLLAVCKPGYGRNGSEVCMECPDRFYSGSGENECLRCGDNAYTDGAFGSTPQTTCSEYNRSVNQSIDQTEFFSKYTLVFFLFCIGLVELVELGEFN